MFDCFGEKDYVVAQLPSAKFILIDVSEDTLYERHVVRNAKLLEQMKMTEE
jgi:hypothetical protein